MENKKRIFTIGHSNRSAEEFVELLIANEVEALIDVRRFPSSKFPYFKGEYLRQILSEAGIEYYWFPALGGYRKKIMDDSPNKAIKSEGFRNYADYMLTLEFERAIEELEEIAKAKLSAIMCAEKLYWRCHRRFISDYLTMKGWEVIHILNDRKIKHEISKEARVVDGRLIYDRT
ncbi:MAG: DUF488 domain-containing protein [Archaeoglobus sp.]|nr:DUF488 domain-containing protein [Archaeoglobus sp.]